MGRSLLIPSFVVAALAAPAPQPVTQLVWPFHGSDGAGGVGGWATSEVPVGAHAPRGVMRLGPDTTVCWDDMDWWFPYNHYGGYFYTGNDRLLASVASNSCIRHRSCVPVLSNPL